MSKDTKQEKQAKQTKQTDGASIRELATEPMPAVDQPLCYARKRGAGKPEQEVGKHSIQSSLEQTPLRIPSSPMGIVDTMRAQLSCFAEEQDLRDLLARENWKRSSDGAFKTFSRSTDGLKVVLRDNMVMVEASVPRVLGLKSDQQHHVTVRQLIATFQSMTSELLPVTTQGALKAGKLWHVTRLDLAINFEGNIDSIISVARKLTFRPLIQAAATVFEGTGIAFYGCNHDAIVYLVAKRPPRGKLSRCLKGQSFSATAQKNLRFEFRFKRPVAIQRLVQGMTPTDDGLPFMVDTPDGRKVCTFAIDYHALHQKLASYAAMLGHGLVYDAVPKKKGASRFMFLALAKWGDTVRGMWDLVRESYADEPYRKVRTAVGKVQAARKRRSVVDAAWAHPQITPVLRALLLAQRAHDSKSERSMRFAD